MHRVLSRHGARLGLCALLAAAAMIAPLVNAAGAPPRAVFLVLPEDQPEPEVALRVQHRRDGQTLVMIDTVGFRFTSICLARATAVPVGHAHVMLDGKKIASAYHPVVDLGVLPPGRHEVKVVLRGQDHRALVGRGGLIGATTIVGSRGV